MIRIYDRLATTFDTNGLAVLNTAKDVCIQRELNGEYNMSFTLPLGDKWKHVMEEGIVKCDNQIFRIKIIDGTKISAQAIYYDACRKHIQYVEDMLGKTPYYIMTRLFAGTTVKILTEAEVSALGMEWITDLTDFFETSKFSPLGCLNKLMESLEKQKVNCELYVDNFNIALVKSIGKDRGAKVDTALNAKKIKPKRDTSKIVTKLFPYGENDLHIDSVTSGSVQYVLSPNVSVFGECEGYMMFSGIDDPGELLQAAQWQFSPDNINRIDIPKYSYDVDVVDISNSQQYSGLHKVHLGDIVTVVDRDFGIASKQRVVSIDYYPYEANRTHIKLGTAITSGIQLFDGLVLDNIVYNTKTNARGELKTNWLEFMQQNETVNINNDLDAQDIALYKTGALFESPDGSSAVAIINGRVAISNRKVNGKWFWTTVSDGGKMIVNEVWTGMLNASNVTVTNDDSSVVINDNGIKIENLDLVITRTLPNTNPVVRIRVKLQNMYSSTVVPFIVEKQIGNGSWETLFGINDSGGAIMNDAIVRGILSTGLTGEARTVIDGNGINSYNSANLKSGLDVVPGYADLTLYHNGSEKFKIYNAVTEIVLKAFEETFLIARDGATYPTGIWNFNHSGLTVNGLNTDTVANHNHGIANNLKIRVQDSNGNEWWEPWTASGAHTHVVKKA